MEADFVYLSPHFDDAILSCGGLIYEQVNAGKKVEIWTVCAGAPEDTHLPEFAQGLHAQWGTAEDAVRTRREEDRLACLRVGAITVHLAWKDCIYRFTENNAPLIHKNEDLFHAEPELDLIQEISEHLRQHVPDRAVLVSPIGVGGHIDHRLTCLAVQKSEVSGLYYADYPYITRDFHQASLLETARWERVPEVISKKGLEAWQEAVCLYGSQISTFWTDREAVKLAISNYCAGGGGRLWKYKG